MDEHLNLFGQVDEAAERAKTYQEAVRKYPLGKGDCTTVQNILTSLTSDIDNLIKKKATEGGAGRIENRQIDGYSKRRTEMEKKLADLGCAATQKAAQTQADYDMQLNLLEQTKGLTAKAGSTTKYIIWGMLGLIVVVAGLVIIRKIAK